MAKYKVTFFGTDFGDVNIEADWFEVSPRGDLSFGHNVIRAGDTPLATAAFAVGSWAKVEKRDASQD